MLPKHYIYIYIRNKTAVQGKERNCVKSVFLTLDGCNDNGRFYRMNDQWERQYMDSTLICTCEGASGVKCKSKPAGERFYHSDIFILSVWDYV